MAISDNYLPLRQIGNGVTTQFSANWAVLAASYLAIFFEDITTGLQTAVTTGFTLAFDSSGFTVTFSVAPPSTVYVVIGRAVVLDQTDPYKTSKGFQGEVVEASFDKLTAITQDIGDGLNRTLTFPLGDTSTAQLTSAQLRANKVLGFDANGAIQYLAPVVTISGQPIMSYQAGPFGLPSSYDYLAGDWGSMFNRLTSSGDATDTLSSALPFGWYAYIYNRMTSDTVYLTAPSGSIYYGNLINGAPYPVYPGEVVLVMAVGTGNFEIVNKMQHKPRRRLLANTNLYVSTAGSDSNKGTQANPFLTIQKAINTVSQDIDLNGFTATINLADGTYAGGGSVTQPWVGGGPSSVIINGNSGTPANVILSGGITVDGQGTGLSLQNFRLATANAGILAQTGGQVTCGAGMIFGANTNYALIAQFGGRIYMNSSYTVNGGGFYHAYANNGMILLNSGITVTFSGTPAFGAQTASSLLGGLIQAPGVTFSGAATGTRYSAITNGVINTGGGGANYFPGNVAGSTATGGQYV